MWPSVQIACAVAWCLVAAGPVFGFAAIKPVLVAQHVYEDACGSKGSGDAPCEAQDLKLNEMFTVAAAVTNIVALVVGHVLDNYGPRLCCYIGSAFLAAGALLLGHQPSAYGIDPFLLGYTSLAIGGPFVFISSFQLANSVPKHSGKILSCITGAFDSSAALFMAYRIYYQHGHADLSLRRFFNGYLVVPLFIVACQLFVMPRDSYKSIGAVLKLDIEGLDENGNLASGDDGSRIVPDATERDRLMRRHSSVASVPLGVHGRTSSSHTTSRRVSRVAANRRKSVLEEFVGARLERKSQGVYGCMHGKSVREQVTSPWFYLMLGLTVLCMLRINYFVATVRSQEQYLLGSTKLANQLSGIFDVALPLGGLVAIPLTGIVLDGLATMTVLKILVTVSVAVGLLGCVPSFWANLVGISVLVVYRPFYYTVVSDYCAKVFGFETFGTVYGLIMSIAGVLNMSQTLIDRATHTYFNMNPVPANMVLTALTAVVGLALVSFGTRSSRERLTSITESAVEDDYGSI